MHPHVAANVSGKDIGVNLKNQTLLYVYHDILIGFFGSVGAFVDILQCILGNGGKGIENSVICSGKNNQTGFFDSA